MARDSERKRGVNYFKRLAEFSNEFCMDDCGTVLWRCGNNIFCKILKLLSSLEINLVSLIPLFIYIHIYF